MFFFFFKQKTAYEMRISDWSSDVCSSDLMNHSLAEYHVPVNADIGDIDVVFVDERDEIVNALGSKGVGEIGIVGVAAAVANAIYHATGKRVRDLDRKSTRLNSSHSCESRMPSSA